MSGRKNGQVRKLCIQDGTGIHLLTCKMLPDLNPVKSVDNDLVGRFAPGIEVEAECRTCYGEWVLRHRDKAVSPESRTREARMMHSIHVDDASVRDEA